MRHISIILAVSFLLGISWIFLGSSAYSTVVSISADSAGNPEDEFCGCAGGVPGGVYGKTTVGGLPNGTDYPLYVVECQDPTYWGTANQTIPPRVDPPGIANDPETTIDVVNGDIQKDAGGTTEDVWKNPPCGLYECCTDGFDIVVDINKDGDFDPAEDLVDTQNACSGGNCGFTLPVELSSFIATTGNGKMLLNWRTETETNNVGFNIYRSEKKNGKFVKVGFVKSANGNSGVPHEYQYVDKTAKPGKVYYYYLEDIDIDGNREKSDIVQSRSKRNIATTWAKLKRR
jgi:hypothetical protein